ncbi:hypothetical protein [Streptomyces sp. VRA16 Mangrove soil]|uniref:hypothetical protein n=1 Tax=Streptomyces sp. VRA16 Mangrove soil TaxID=2817434 RepID=UPI001A9D37DD|nr:hypothetical protein [Streptomyces sp. VRA16 Mangrove soil]MBO1334378.1 hypothetical protein [Streptomyces sp. VRA16 Mangrove soil]
MESQIEPHETELIKPRGPWRGLDDAEIGTAERVDRFNNQRSTPPPETVPPHELETHHYAQHQPLPAAGVTA